MSDRSSSPTPLRKADDSSKKKHSSKSSGSNKDKDPDGSKKTSKRNRDDSFSEDGVDVGEDNPKQTKEKISSTTTSSGAVASASAQVFNSNVQQIVQQLNQVDLNAQVSPSAANGTCINNDEMGQTGVNVRESVLNASSFLSLSDAPKLDSYEPREIRKFWDDFIRYEYNSKNANIRKTLELKPAIAKDIQMVIAVNVFKAEDLSNVSEESLRQYFLSFSEKEENIASVNFDHILKGIDIRYDSSNVDEALLKYIGAVVTRLKEKRVSNLIALKSEDNPSVKKIIDTLISQVSDPSIKGNLMKRNTLVGKYKTLFEYFEAVREYVSMLFTINGGYQYLRATSQKPLMKQNINGNFHVEKDAKKSKITRAAKPSDKCFRCGQRGHFSSNCKAPKEVAEKREEEHQKLLSMKNGNKTKYGNRSIQEINNIELDNELPGSINNVNFRCLLDSGAEGQTYCCSVMLPRLMNAKCNVRYDNKGAVTMADGCKKNIIATVIIPKLTIKGVEINNIDCYVVAGNDEIIKIGTTILNRVGFNLAEMWTQLKNMILDFNSYKSSQFYCCSSFMSKREEDRERNESESESESENERVAYENENSIGMGSEDGLRLYFGQSTTIPSVEVLFKDWMSWKIEVKKLVQTFYEQVLCVLWKATYNTNPIRIDPAEIELKADRKVIRMRRSKFSPKEIDFIKQLINQLIKADCIVKCERAEWYCPTIVISDNNGQPKRLVTDLREINKQCVDLQWIMPDIDVELLKVTNMKYFTIIDLAKGYWQYPLSERSGRYLAFATHDAIYRYKRLPQGFKNSVFLFQALISSIIRELDLDNQVIVWIDDLLISTETIEENINILTLILDRFKHLNIRINWEKSRFFQCEIKYLGRDISDKGITFDRDKMSTMSGLPNPKTANELQNFINSCGFMRCVIPSYSEVSLPLHNLLERAFKECGGKRTKKSVMHFNIESMWSEECEKSFNRIKELLSYQLMLGYFKSDDDLYIFADASDTGYGILVTQTSVLDRCLPLLERNHVPIGCWSGLFKGSEKNWDISSREIFPFLVALNKFHHFLHRKLPFNMVTDNRNLAHIISPEGYINIEQAYTRSRVYRWSLAFMAYNYTITLIPGEKNYFCDMVSRWAQSSIESREKRNNQINKRPRESEGEGEGNEEGKEFYVNAIRNSGIIANNNHSSITEKIQHIKSILKSRMKSRETTSEVESSSAIEYIIDSSMSIEYPSRKEILIAAGKSESDDDNDLSVLTVPDVNNLRLRIFIIGHMHLGGHLGYYNTYKVISKKYHWDGMKDDIKDWCSKCCHCMSAKMNKIIHRPWGTTIRGTAPNSVLTMDYLYLGKNQLEDLIKSPYLLVLKDDFSMYSKIYPADKIDAMHACRCVIEWIITFGPPKMITSDQGVQFTSELFKELNKSYQIRHHITTSDVHHNLGSAERANRQVLEMFKTLMSELHMSSDRWIQVIDIVQYALNNYHSKRLNGLTPKKCFLGLESESPFIEMGFGKEIALLNEVDAKRLFLERIETLQNELANIITNCNETRAKIIDRENSYRSSKRGVKQLNVKIGEWVYVYKNDREARNKLDRGAKGPLQVIATKSDGNVITVRDVITGTESDAHMEHVKFFSKELQLDENMRSHITRNSPQGYILDKIIGLQKKGNHISVKVGFRGNAETEIWDLHRVWNESQTMLRQYLKHNKNLPLARKASKELKITSGTNQLKKLKR